VRANRVRELWAARKPAINGCCGIPSSFSAEVMAHAGWDSRHDRLPDDRDYAAGQLDRRFDADGACRRTIRRTSKRRSTPGAHGIVCSMINNRAEVEKFVGSCRYAPLGYRSSGRSVRHSMAAPIITPRRMT
jgi:4-hydroxy-2-oxoheptanedioate aldolase